jgi:protein-tyrosine phosphatase
VSVAVVNPSVLFVCTANICRSPMAEVMFRRRTEDMGYACSVSSAGLLRANQSAAELAIRAMADRGIDLADHRSTTLTDEGLRSATLVVTMTADHQLQAVALEQRAWPRIFTLTEVCARIASIGPRADRETAAQYVARLHDGRSASAAMNAGDAGDIADPYGGPRAGYEYAADLLDQYTAQLASAIAARPVVRSSPAVSVVSSIDDVPAEVTVSSRSRLGRLFRRS